MDLVDRTDWSRVRAAVSVASEVPSAVRALAGAASAEEADAAYWRLDNYVVVQGQLHESALPLVPVLLAILDAGVGEFALERTVDLLVEIVSGESDQREVALGNDDLGSRCRTAARDGLPALYALLSTPGAITRLWALHVIEVIELDRERMRTVFARVASEDPDERVRGFAADVA